ncbi:DNA primase [Kordia antarctica]|uniref:DNA primase n=1 Tax=Kordia antarctica TaxID=1218801 RepID=A0A7L4ZQE2_9FLAO|nr:DNA primase [Kordia antarctica]QHI38386.1 DNA primase [Kordia antarctica]
MISKSTIDAVFDAARVEEVIGDFVQLKKSGSNFKGLSPFSEERTPSFMVSPVKQIWKDFSSGKGGNAVAFLMEHEHFTYPEAIKYLANKYGIEVEETERTDEEKELANEKESMFLVSEYAKKYHQDILWESPQGKAIGLTYFKERGFTPETIKKFGLGYALDEWDAFTTTALKEGYNLNYLAKTGVTIVKDEKRFDRFKGRVMFPIHSMSGRVLGFGGRILTNTKKAAKYLNSPESDIYHKSKVLYGLYYAKQAIAKEDNCYLVEGYTDVIQMHQAGIHNVVSSSGTALTADQIRLINRLTKNITVLYDGDAAGIRASLRGVDLILEQDMNVRVCTFPDGEDPDSFAKNNSLQDVLEYFENNVKDFISYKASLLMEVAKNDPIKKAEVINDMMSSISKVSDRIKQELYLRETSRIMNISEEVLFATLAQLQNRDIKEANKKTTQEKKAFEVIKTEKKAEAVDVQYVLERKIIEILLLYGNMEATFEDLILKEDDEGELKMERELFEAKVFEKLYLDLQQDEIDLANETFKAIYYSAIEKLNTTGTLELDTFVNEIAPEIASEVTDILMREERYELHNWEAQNIFVKTKEETIAQLTSETILSLRCFLINLKIEELKLSLQQNAELEKLQSVLEEITNYISLKKALSEQLKRVL